MLPDEDIDKLCQGRIIYASVYQSDGKDAAGPHYAVILDTDEEVAANDSYYVVVISNNDTIDSFILPVPPRIGLTGFFQCSWITVVQLPGIIRIGTTLSVPEMANLIAMVRRACQARK
jgi:hypothetical protein